MTIIQKGEPMRLIDADDFGNRMYHEAFEKDSDLQKWDSGCWIRYKLFENVLREQPTIQPVATDTNVGDTISRKGVFIPNITVEMFRNASLVGVEDLMVSGEMEDISLPSAQPEQKWIPCSERLPEESGYYIITAHDGISHRTTFVKYQKKAKSWDLIGARSYWRVIAWMPLPEPYQEGEQDG